MEEGNIVLRTNLFIMRELYRKLGTKEVADTFIEKKGDREYLIPFPEVLKVDKQRIGRILTSNCYSKIQEKEQQRLALEFGIPSEYFDLSGDTFLCDDLSKDEWGKYFENRSKKDTLKYTLYQAHCAKSYAILKDEVSELSAKIIDRCNQGVYSVNDPIYRIWWYYKHGESIHDDLSSIISKKIEHIEKTPAREWKEVSDECLQKAIKVFQKVLGDLQALDRCRKEGFIEKK